MILGLETPQRFRIIRAGNRGKSRIPARDSVIIVVIATRQDGLIFPRVLADEQSDVSQNEATQALQFVMQMDHTMLQNFMDEKYARFRELSPVNN